MINSKWTSERQATNAKSLSLSAAIVNQFRWVYTILALISIIWNDLDPVNVKQMKWNNANIKHAISISNRFIKYIVVFCLSFFFHSRHVCDCIAFSIAYNLPHDKPNLGWERERESRQSEVKNGSWRKIN